MGSLLAGLIPRNRQAGCDTVAALLLRRVRPLMALRAIPPTGPGGSYRGNTGRGNLWPARQKMTRSDRLLVINTALQKGLLHHLVGRDEHGLGF